MGLPAVPGLGLGAVGLALKLVVLQIIGVNIHCRLIAKANGWAHEYGHQAAVLFVFLTLGWLCKWGAGEGLSLAGLLGSGQVGIVILGGGLYAVLSLCLVYRSPWLAGLTRDQIQFAVSSAARKLRLVTVAR